MPNRVARRARSRTCCRAAARPRPHLATVSFGDVLDEREADAAAAHVFAVRRAPRSKRSKMRLRSSGAMPGPRSVTRISSAPEARRTTTNTLLPSAAYFSALSIRLMTAISMARSSRRTGERSDSTSKLEYDALALGAHSASVHRAHHDVAELPVRELVRLLAALDLGEIEHVLDERGEPLALAHDDLRGTGAAFPPSRRVRSARARRTCARARAAS